MGAALLVFLMMSKKLAIAKFVEATVAVGNDIVRVVYNFVVQRKDIERLQPAEDRKLCPKGLFWKISGSSEVGSSPCIAGSALKSAKCAPCNQHGTMQAEKTVGIFGFQMRQRLLEQVFTLNRARSNIFEIGLEIEHFSVERSSRRFIADPVTGTRGVGAANEGERSHCLGKHFLAGARLPLNQDAGRVCAVPNTRFVSCIRRVTAISPCCAKSCIGANARKAPDALPSDPA